MGLFCVQCVSHSYRQERRLAVGLPRWPVDRIIDLVKSKSKLRAIIKAQAFAKGIVWRIRLRKQRIIARNEALAARPGGLAAVPPGVNHLKMSALDFQRFLRGEASATNTGRPINPNLAGPQPPSTDPNLPMHVPGSGPHTHRSTARSPAGAATPVAGRGAAGGAKRVFSSSTRSKRAGKGSAPKAFDLNASQPIVAGKPKAGASPAVSRQAQLMIAASGAGDSVGAGAAARDGIQTISGQAPPISALDVIKPTEESGSAEGADGALMPDGTPVTPEQQAAALKLQALYRSRLARYNIAWMIGQLYVQQYDEETGHYYYMHRETGETRWTLPSFAGDQAYAFVQPGH